MKCTPAQNAALKAARQVAGRGQWFVFSSYPQVLDGLERRGLVTDVRIPRVGQTEHSAVLTLEGVRYRRGLRGVS